MTSTISEVGRQAALTATMRIPALASPFDATGRGYTDPLQILGGLAYVDVASATTTDIGAAASDKVRITGTTTITGLGTVTEGTQRTLRFAASLTLTHNATSLILPGAANITTAANDTAEFVSLGSGNWICISYKRASGFPVNDGVTKTVPTYAALTALTAATGLADNGIYYTYARTTEEDGGEGLWVYDSASTATANTGTILAIDGGGAGRFFRLHDGWVSLEMFGGGTVGSGVASNTTAYNAWVTAMGAGTAPKTLRFVKDGTYHWETKPSRLEELSSVTIYADGIRVVVTRGWDSASDVKEAIFHAYGATQLVAYGFAAGTAADNSYGGAIITLEATASAAPDFSNLQHLYLTSYGNASAKTITSATTANPAVFTSAAHGYANGDTVVYLYGLGGTWASMTHQLFDVSDVTTDTFRLKYAGTSTYFDSSGLGSYTANSASVKRAYCTDYPVVIDGSARTTGAIGVRGVKIHNCQIFGGRKGALLSNGAIGLDMPGTTTSDAGWDGTIRATGTASVPNYYINLNGGSVARVALDRCYYTVITAQVQGELVQTANTLYTNALSPIGKTVTRLGTQNSGPDFIWLGGGMALQKKAITGVTGSYATFTWPVAFRSAPVIYDGVGINSGSFAIVIMNAVSTTGVQVAGSNLSAGGDVIIWAIGEI